MEKISRKPIEKNTTPSPDQCSLITIHFQYLIVLFSSSNRMIFQFPSSINDLILNLNFLPFLDTLKLDLINQRSPHSNWNSPRDKITRITNYLNLLRKTLKRL